LRDDSRKDMPEGYAMYTALHKTELGKLNSAVQNLDIAVRAIRPAVIVLSLKFRVAAGFYALFYTPKKILIGIIQVFKSVLQGTFIRFSEPVQTLLKNCERFVLLEA